MISKRTILFPVLGLLVAVGCTSGSDTKPAPPPRGTDPVNSDLAAFTNGGGCYPKGVNAGDADDIVEVNPHWAPVVNGQVPDSDPVLIHGIAHGSHGDTGGDYPPDHRTSDATVQVEPDPADRGLAATGNGRGYVELEWESGAWPAWAWPGEGDRIVALGRWIFDCGHNGAIAGHCSATPSQPCLIPDDCAAPTCASCQSGETCEDAHFTYQTEIHPPQATATIRQGRGAVVGNDPSAPAVPATRVDVFVSPDGGPAGDRCAMTHRPLNEFIFSTDCYPLAEPLAPINKVDFAFDVPLPARPAGAMPSWRIEQHDVPGGVPANLEVKLVDGDDPHLAVTVKMTQAIDVRLPTGYAGTIFAGWSAPSDPLTHVRVTVDAVLVKNALKPVTAVVRESPGWAMQVVVNGEAQRLGGLDAVQSGDTVAQSVVFDQYLPAGGALDVFANGVSHACVDTMFGKAFKTSAAELSLANFEPCIRDSAHDIGTVHATYTGPDFGSGGGSMAYEEASKGSEGGACSVTTATPCLGDHDCPSGETCVPSDGAFTLKYRVERIP